jgi:hypothetical protein
VLRRLLRVGLFGVLAGAAASTSADTGPAMWAEPDPAAVVGRWRATIKWRGCAATGAARAVLGVERDGSGYAIDLAPVLDGLGPEVLVPLDAKKLEATRDDLRVEWTIGRHNRAALAVKFASGCTGTLALTREATGAPACDQLVALQAIAARCDGVEAPAISDDDQQLIARARAPRTRGAAARTCTRHAAPLRTSLVAAGCVPAPADPAGPGVSIPECEALVVAVSRLARCNKVPADSKERLLANMQRVVHWSRVKPPDNAEQNLENAKQLCVHTREELEEIMQVIGC